MVVTITSVRSIVSNRLSGEGGQIVKAAICHECKGLVVPQKGSPGVGVHCPCGSVAMTYTGNTRNGNEVAIVGEATIISMLDSDWNALLDHGAETRLQINMWTVPTYASTVVTLAADT